MADLTLPEFVLARIAEKEALADAHVLAECKALRAIVEEHPHKQHGSDGRGREDEWACQTCHAGNGDWWCVTLRALGSIWSDHPDYRQEWAL